MSVNARLYCPRVGIDDPSFVAPGAAEVVIQVNDGDDKTAPPAYAYLRATGKHDPDGLEYWTEIGAALPEVEERP